MNINKLPENIIKEIKETLKSYNQVNITFYNGNYHVSPGCFIAEKYYKDFCFISMVHKENIYTKEEQDINYIESFHDYPAGYTGKRNYKMLNDIGNDYTIKFKYENGNLVLA